MPMISDAGWVAIGLFATPITYIVTWAINRATAREKALVDAANEKIKAALVADNEARKAAQAEIVAVKVAAVATDTALVKDTLARTSEVTNIRLDALQEGGKVIHTLVNNSYSEAKAEIVKLQALLDAKQAENSALKEVFTQKGKKPTRAVTKRRN